ncbi:MAG: tRNA pseudouridine(38-40) synthase TruA [Bacteroidia bacterium]|nr:tRNA pseudouridine(38-40) synthase TruA [Bacteroidia bacterium]
MRKYVLKIAYDGTKYAGWQRQSNALAVAQVVEEAIEVLTRSPVKLIGAGRTDAGVHARAQIAHWETQTIVPTPFLKRLNGTLPGDIQAISLYEGSPSFHARHSAIQRTYRYFIRWVPDPFRRAYSLPLSYPPHLDVLNEAARMLIGTHDFTAFTKELRDQPNRLCSIFEAYWRMEMEGYAFFEITANRFLRAMVRALVAAQLRLMQGRLSWEAFRAALFEQDRRWGVQLAPPQGLFLWSVAYPPKSLFLLESYALFPIEPGSASGFTPESETDSACPFAGGSSGGVG